MIPIYNAIITDPVEGIYKISLVDAPAVESNFMYFNKNDKEMKFAIEDEEQRIVFGVLMRADYNIYRVDKELGEFYIRYSKDVIKQMAEKMLADGTQNNINLMHQDGTDVEGVNLLELFVKDSAKGINPKGFENIEEGSLFCSYKVENDAIWQEIKAGTFLGFSLEGIFTIDKTTNTNKFNKIMNRLTKKFINAIVKFGSVKTDKGELYWVGEADLEIGDELFIQDGEDRVKVEDGVYTMEDGTEITVAEGLVSEIKTKEGEPEGELDMEKKEEKCEEEPATEEAPAAEAPAEEPSEIDKLKADIDALRASHDELRGIVDTLKAEVEELIQKPAAEPIVEEFEKVAKINGNSKINNALNIIRAGRK